MPFGLCTSPRVFTKLMKPVMRFLRNQGLKSVIYLDDILCIADSFDACKENIRTTIHLLKALGFVINHKKSNLIPSKCCKFLGFVIDTDRFILKLPESKKKSLTKILSLIYGKDTCRISLFAHLIGKLVAASPAVEYGNLYIKLLEKEKIRALRINNGDYSQRMKIPKYILPDLEWWKTSLKTASCSIKKDQFDLVIFSDASDSGWGATDGNRSIQGFWDKNQSSFHINYKELLAVKFGLEKLASKTQNSQILLRIDNTTAIAYVNRMGSVKYSNFNDLAREIWQWAEKRRNFLRASYIPSEENCEADALSRIKNEDTEWEIAEWAVTRIFNRFGKPKIDLFATCENKKCDLFCSRYPSPEAWAIDAFTVNWSELDFYAFPPFAMILKVLAKIKQDKATGIIIIPHWINQPWFPLFKELLTSEPISFQPNKFLLLSKYREKRHPQAGYISLLAARVSGRHS